MLCELVTFATLYKNMTTFQVSLEGLPDVTYSVSTFKLTVPDQGRERGLLDFRVTEKSEEVKGSTKN